LTDAFSFGLHGVLTFKQHNKSCQNSLAPHKYPQFTLFNARQRQINLKTNPSTLASPTQAVIEHERTLHELRITRIDVILNREQRQTIVNCLAAAAAAAAAGCMCGRT
jgi:hypothetical protein